MAKLATARPDDPASATGAPADEFTELRTLLVGPEQRQLRALQTRLDDPVSQARDVSRVLPAAVELRARDPHLKRVLAPTIEETISASVRRNPKPLADALFPIIGPAIRKAIATTLNGMLESLNTTLDHSLSWRSVRWRLDARRTGKSFAEIVLLNTLVYRVEQVFLIHRPSGLLLQHLTAPGTAIQDPDLVSGMLTAIRDFVQDSFKVSDDEGLQTLKLGELSVWIEQGPSSLLAVVIRGSAPPDLRTTLQRTLENVHGQYSDVLEAFDGDVARLEGARPLLEACFQQQYRHHDRHKHPAPALKLLIGLLILAMGLWGFVAIRSRLRWNGYLDTLRAQPGIVVVATDREDGRYVVTGLRDPLASDPGAFLSQHRLAADRVVGRWQLYQALEPALVLARARQLLRPPSGVDLQLDGGVLTASGTAAVDWIEASARIAPVLPGVTRFDATRVIDASQQTLVAAIEAAAPLFVKGTTTFTPGSERIVGEQIERLHMLNALGRSGGRRYVLELVGQADSDGAPESNLPLSQQRVARVLGMIQSERLDRVSLTGVGIGSRGAAESSAAEDSKQRNRRVAFRVTRAPDSR